MKEGRKRGARVLACILNAALLAGSLLTSPVKAEAQEQAQMQAGAAAQTQNTPVSQVAYSGYDRDQVLEVGGEPFFFNGVQIRVDRLRDGWNYTDEQIEELEKVEAEALEYTTNSLKTRVSSGDSNASGGAFLAIDSSKEGDYIEFEVTVPDYITSAKIVTGYKTKNNRGNLQLSVNGVTYGQPIAMAANEEKYVCTEAGSEIALKAGEKNKFRYTVTKGGVLCLDYIGMYYKADITKVGLLTDAAIGTVIQNPSESSGTDSHTAVVSSLDKSSKTVTSYIKKEADLAALPITFSFRRTGTEILLEGKPFANGDVVDFSQGDQVFTFQYGDYAENWTIKQPAIAYNAVLPGQYADPDIDILDGKFWIFPTTDGNAEWSGTKFHAFSSSDLVHWEDEGVIVDLAAEKSYKNENNVDVAVVPWASGHAWAPSIEEKDGKYYFYFCGQWEESKETVTGRRQAIGVAVADNPAGPYKAMAQPLITREEWFQAINRTSGGQCIDPSIFKDDNGIYYMMFGNGIPSVAQLGEDMQSIVPGTIKTLSGLTNFTESVVVNKINGKYHFTWTCNDTGSPDYCVRYGTSDSVYGPVNSRGIILQKNATGDMLGTGHQSILRNGDDYYIAYHRFYTPLGIYTEGLGYHRETCIEKLSFDAEGYLKAVEPTMEGPGETAPYNAELKNSLALAEEILKEKDNYEESGVRELEKAIEKAREVYADYYATIEMVSQSVEELERAEAALKPDRPEEPVVSAMVKVTFDANGGTGTYGEQEVQKGERAKKPEKDPVREGYVFKGWAKEDGKLFDFTKETVEASMTLKATWEKVPSPEPIKVSSIKFASKSYRIAQGKKINLKKEIIVRPSNAANKEVTWSIAKKDKKYASITKGGAFTAKKAGAGRMVTVTATAADKGAAQKSVKIKIMKHAVKKISLTAKRKAVKPGKKLKITAEITTNGKKANKSLVWKSSNATYASISSKGILKAKKAGIGKTVTITARATDGTGKKATIKIKIKR